MDLLNGIVMAQSLTHKTSIEAYSDLEEKQAGYLVDVRTNNELSASGVVDLSSIGAKVIFCEWKSQLNFDPSYDFTEELLKKIQINETAALYFICAAGIRSYEAAKRTMADLSHMRSNINFVNISDGFEGISGFFFNYGKNSGWKKSGLPWCQFDKI